MNKSDMIGKRFGELIVVAYAGKEEKSKKSTYLCRCNCGKSKIINGVSLKRGLTKSCGCLKSKLTSERTTTHGKSKHPLFRGWWNMKDRCYNKKNKSYHRYGGRGIYVCEEWKNSISAFMLWAEKNGWEKGLSLERKDNSKGYSPENCAFVSAKKQANNRRDNKTLSFNGETKTVAQWGDALNIKASTIRYRIKAGWSTKKSLN